MPLLEVNQLKKVYTTRFGGNQINALNGVSFTVEPENTLRSWESQDREKPPS